MKHMVEQLPEYSEVLGENLPPCHFDHHKPHICRPWTELRLMKHETGTASAMFQGHMLPQFSSKTLVLTCQTARYPNREDHNVKCEF